MAYRTGWARWMAVAGLGLAVSGSGAVLGAAAATDESGQARPPATAPAGKARKGVKAVAQTAPAAKGKAPATSKAPARRKAPAKAPAQRPPTLTIAAPPPAASPSPVARSLPPGYVVLPPPLPPPPEIVLPKVEEPPTPQPVVEEPPPPPPVIVEKPPQTPAPPPAKREEKAGKMPAPPAKAGRTTAPRPAPAPPERPMPPVVEPPKAGQMPAPPAGVMGEERHVVPAPEAAPPVEMAAAFRGILSRDDDRYPKEMRTMDGIVVKLEDTDREPLNADVKIRVGRYSMKWKHIHAGQPIYGRGASGQSYRMIIERINPKKETIWFVIEMVSPGVQYREEGWP